MLKKTQRTLENKYGIEDYNEGFLNRPCILGIVPSSNNTKMRNGYLGLFMYLLQIRKYNLVDSDYDITDIPFDLLINDMSDKLDLSILDKTPANNIVEAKNIMRNINIISYCDGNSIIAFTLKRLDAGLLNKGYSEEEARQIISQVFVLQIVDNYQDGRGNTEIPYATVVTVHDIFDIENTDYYFENQEQNLFDDNPFIHLETRNNSDRYVIYKSFGNGSLAERQGEHFFETDYAKAPIINYIMSLYLIRALHSSFEHSEISNIFSLRQEIDDTIRRALEFCSSKKKSYEDFTRGELEELNEFLMKEIQSVFKSYIPVSTLTTEEKESLNTQDKDLIAFLNANPYLYLKEMINTISNIVSFIFQLNNNYGDDEIAYHENTNYGIFEHKKDSAIKLHAKSLASSFNEFMKAIDSVIIPDGITPIMRQKIKEYLESLVVKVRNIVLNDNLQQILERYCDAEAVNAFRH